MDAATLTSIIAALIAVLTGIGTYFTTARKSELEALRETIAIQDRSIETLQKELDRERKARQDTEAELQRVRAASDAEIRQLKTRIEELEGVDKRRRRGFAGRPPDDRGLE